MTRGRAVPLGLLCALGGAVAAACYAPGDAPAERGQTSEEAWTACQASDQAWVKRTMLALLGRRPWGQAEVDVYEDVVRGIDAIELGGSDTSTTLAARGVLSPGRAAVAKLLSREDDFRLRWSDFLMDTLHVARIEAKSQRTCWGEPRAQAVDDGGLAAWVRDHDATEGSAQRPAFTMNELVSSALELDDVSVVYRAHLFAMLSRPLIGANLDPVALERSRRQDFGGIFDAIYLHRNLVCLQCHNSEYSTTYDPDPAKNRAWPVRGLFERALYGASNALHPPAEVATQGSDDLRAHSMLRHDIVNVEGAVAPYGWDDKACGAFGRAAADPLLGVDTYFGSVRGQGATVWDLEASLRRGVDALAAHGLGVEASGAVGNADEAFAYLVAQTLVEKVWTEVVGSALTVVNDFPRNQTQRDTLARLTGDFVRSHFSLRALLANVVGHPAYNLASATDGCGSGPFALPALFDPWTVANTSPDARGNGAGDAVFALSPRPLVRSLHRALEWPYVPEYPADASHQAALGFFLKDATPGFRGLDFQGRITWESLYGACAREGEGDFVTRVAATVRALPDATLGDGVVALKDRLLGEPAADDAEERTLLEAVLGDGFGSRDFGDADAKLRRVCGVFVSSPQFMLGGTVPPDTRVVPKAAPPEHGIIPVCQSLSGALASLGYAVACAPEGARVSRTK